MVCKICGCEEFEEKDGKFYCKDCGARFKKVAKEYNNLSINFDENDNTSD